MKSYEAIFKSDHFLVSYVIYVDPVVVNGENCILYRPVDVSRCEVVITQRPVRKIFKQVSAVQRELGFELVGYDGQ